jgi:hypothetical protein
MPYPPLRAELTYLSAGVGNSVPNLRKLGNTNFGSSNDSTSVTFSNGSGQRRAFNPLATTSDSTDIRTTWKGWGWCYFHPDDIRPTDSRGRAFVVSQTLTVDLNGTIRVTSGTQNPIGAASTFRVAASLWRFDPTGGQTLIVSSSAGPAPSSASVADLLVGPVEWNGSRVLTLPALILERGESLAVQVGIYDLAFTEGALGAATAGEIRLQLQDSFVRWDTQGPRVQLGEAQAGVSEDVGVRRVLVGLGREDVSEDVPAVARYVDAARARGAVSEDAPEVGRVVEASRAEAQTSEDLGVRTTKVGIPRSQTSEDLGDRSIFAKLGREQVAEDVGARQLAVTKSLDQVNEDTMTLGRAVILARGVAGVNEDEARGELQMSFEVLERSFSGGGGGTTTVRRTTLLMDD